MRVESEKIEKSDTLYDIGRDFAERGRLHGAVVESEFDRCAFDKWRKSVNDFLYDLGGCEDPYYQRFSKDVKMPTVRDLEEGLRILAAVRDEMACSLVHSQETKSKKKAGCGRLSVSYH